MKLDFDKKLKKEFKRSTKGQFNIKEILKYIAENSSDEIDKEHKPTFYIFPFVLLVLTFLIFIWSLINLQIFSYDEYLNKSANNQYETIEIKPNRGIIVDSKGRKVAYNVPAVSVFVDKSLFINSNYEIDQDKLNSLSVKIEEILKEELKKSNTNVSERISQIWNQYSLADRGWIKKVEILSQLPNEASVKIKSANIDGITAVNGNVRNYPYRDSFSHILGYTGNVFAQDLESLDYISFNDVVGKSGLEQVYDKQLFGKKGKTLIDRSTPDDVITIDAISGATLHLSIDAKVQEILFDKLKRGVAKYGADGGAAILQDVNTGEIIAMTTYPSFNNNQFIGGISTKEYQAILKSGKNPLLNRAIAAQVPPGSTFKTIVASAALDAGVIKPSTVYVSRRGYTFSDGRSFQEYGNNSYGSLDLISAISVSSNIYFCEVIRNWDMDKLVPYLKKFGIGQLSGIDLLGEAPGRLPSPENKRELAKYSPWLDPVWYPEGDSCNSVIGQGITTVTPIQMVNWVSAIANGGTLNSPRIGKMLEYPDGSVEKIESTPLYTKIAKDSALSVVREGMWASVNGPRRVIIPLSNAKPTVAAKTGTAEFGRINKDGRYEKTHAWVTGFFPYNKPKYAFVVFLEDGGASNNSAQIARDFIDWFNEYNSK